MTALVQEMRCHEGDAVLVGAFETGSPEWHAARAKGLGGSEIAAVLGLSQYESRFSLWHRKAGLVGPQDLNGEMEWGNRLEPLLLSKFQENHHWITMLVTHKTWANAERPWQIANPDAVMRDITGTGCVWEAKTARYDDGWGIPGSDEIPPGYLAQVRWYLDTFGFHRAFISVLIAGSDYREYEVTADPTDAELMRTEARKFLDDVAAGKRPSIDGHSETYVIARKLHPDIDRDTTVEIPATYAQRYLRAVKGEARAKATRSRYNALIAMRMGRAHKATYLGEVIAQRIPGRGTAAPYVKAAKQKDES